MRQANLHAIPPPHLQAVLGLAQIRDVLGEPQSDRHQRDREGDGGDVGEHAVVKIVRFFPDPLIARQVVRFVWVFRVVPAWIPLLARQVSRMARPELEHAVLFF